MRSVNIKWTLWLTKCFARVEKKEVEKKEQHYGCLKPYPGSVASLKRDLANQLYRARHTTYISITGRPFEVRPRSFCFGAVVGYVEVTSSWYFSFETHSFSLLFSSAQKGKCFSNRPSIHPSYREPAQDCCELAQNGCKSIARTHQ